MLRRLTGDLYEYCSLRRNALCPIPRVLNLARLSHAEDSLKTWMRDLPCRLADSGGESGQDLAFLVSSQMVQLLLAQGPHLAVPKPSGTMNAEGITFKNTGS